MPDRDSDQERAWSYYQHADNLLHQRHSIFIVAQSIFFAAFVQAVTAETGRQNLQWAISGIGFVYAIAWWWLSERLRERMHALEPYLRKDSVYCVYLDVFKKAKLKRFISARRTLNIALPIMTAITWALLTWAFWNRPTAN